MEEQTQTSDGKKYLFVAGFLILLVVIGAYFVNKIPTTSNGADQLSQIDQTNDTINESDSENILGAQESEKLNMDEKLTIEDLIAGTGTEAVAGKRITVNYTGTLTDGTKFDSSLNPGRTPFEFTLGAGEVIAGWDQGFNGMKVGGKRKLTIPPALGYGSQDLGTIPPNSILIFEVELLKVE